MKYEVGDKVTIRSWEAMEREFGLDYDGCIKCRWHFMKGMRPLCGRQMIIMN